MDTWLDLRYYDIAINVSKVNVLFIFNARIQNNYIAVRVLQFPVSISVLFLVRKMHELVGKDIAYSCMDEPNVHYICLFQTLHLRCFTKIDCL